MISEDFGEIFIANTRETITMRHNLYDVLVWVMFRLVLLFLTAILLNGCSNLSAKAPYRTQDGEYMIINANMPAGNLKLWINDQLLIDEPFINQDKSLSGILSDEYTNVYNRMYKNKKVMVRCSRKSNGFSSPLHECDVFINNEYAAKLFLR